MDTCGDLIFQKKVAEEEKIKEKVDENGVKWRKVYFGGGPHFENWLEQSKELGEVSVEEVTPEGYECFKQAGEKLYRIWVKE
ncbi:MAG: hypothetical protein NTV30_03115 [Chloroflexi bacterium]|nr:hypothetical protein [Chloroflexota bacterium]